MRNFPDNVAPGGALPRLCAPVAEKEPSPCHDFREPRNECEMAVRTPSDVITLIGAFQQAPYGTPFSYRFAFVCTTWSGMQAGDPQPHDLTRGKAHQYERPDQTHVLTNGYTGLPSGRISIRALVCCYFLGSQRVVQAPGSRNSSIWRGLRVQFSVTFTNSSSRTCASRKSSIFSRAATPIRLIISPRLPTRIFF